MSNKLKLCGGDIIPVPIMLGNILCPVNAVSNHLASGPCIPAQAALFSYNVSDGVYKNLCNGTFIAILRDLLSRCGLPSHRYSAHSFRRGGASFAANCGIPIDQIKAQGDWRSSAVEHYLPSIFQRRKCLVSTISKCLKS